jgi:hypothetical protein
MRRARRVRCDECGELLPPSELKIVEHYGKLCLVCLDALDEGMVGTEAERGGAICSGERILEWPSGFVCPHGCHLDTEGCPACVEEDSAEGRED